jgi:Tfp pilus assembly protein PilF
MGSVGAKRYRARVKNRREGPSKAALFLLSAAALTAACAGGPRPPAAPNPAPVADMSRAYEFLRQGRPEDAAGVLREILKTDPESRPARTQLAYVDIGLKRWKDAVELLDSLIEEDPSNMRLRMERGYARLALGQRAEAADDFALVALAPGEFQAQALAASKASAAEPSAADRDARTDALLNEGYDALRRGDKPGARAKFSEALLEDPGRTIISKQLGYMSIADGNLSQAVQELEGVRRLAPLDYETALELGYIYDSLHEDAAALKSFAAALPSPDPKIRGAAAAALKNIRARSNPFYLDVYAAPYNSSRFGDKIAYFEASAGWKPDPDGPFSLYFGTRYTEDSLSRGGTVPEIYSDNYVSLDPGIRIQPKGWNANLTAEWGPAFNLVRSASHPDATEFDGRVVLADYRYWDAPHRLFADAGGSVGFYSRYQDDVIGYLQLRAGDKVWDDHKSQLSLYVPLNVYKDTNADFYNNAVEVGVGLEIQPWTKLNLKFRAEALRGTYMGIAGPEGGPNPYGPHYDDVRLTLIYFGHFTRDRAADESATARRPGYRW